MCAGSEVMQSGMGWGEERTLGTGLPALAGEEYVACVPDDSSGAVALVAFSAAPEGPLAPEACSALCFAAGQALAALSEQGRCLCGAMALIFAPDPQVPHFRSFQRWDFAYSPMLLVVSLCVGHR